MGNAFQLEFTGYPQSKFAWLKHCEKEFFFARKCRVYGELNHVEKYFENWPLQGILVLPILCFL